MAISSSAMGGTQSSNNDNSNSGGHGAEHASKDGKACYYELLGVDRLASDEE